MASRYWVGGSANWDGTAGSKWALTSGGAGGQAVPTTSDNVFFDANSGAVTVTISANVNCANLDTSGFTGNLLRNFDIQCNGSLTLAISSSSGNGTFTFGAVSTGKTITTNGINLEGPIFNGVGGGWQLQDNLTSTGADTTLTAGTLDFNGKTINLGSQAMNISGSITRTLAMGASHLICAVWTATTITNLTFNANTSLITCSMSFTFNGGGLTYYDVTITTTTAQNITGPNTFHNFLNASTGSGIPTFTGSNTFNSYNSNAGRTNKFTAGTTQTVNSMSIDGTAGNLVVMQSTAGTYNFVGTGSAITLNYVSISNCHFSGVTVNAYHSIDGGGNSGIIFHVGGAIATIDNIALANIAMVNGVSIANLLTFNGSAF